MRVVDLIKELEKFDDDAIVTLTGLDGGWSNIADVKQDGSAVTITNDTNRPFSSD